MPAARRFPPEPPAPRPRPPRAAALALAVAPAPGHPAPAGATRVAGAAPPAPRPALSVQALAQGSGLSCLAAAQPSQAASLLAAAAGRLPLRWSPRRLPRGRQRYGRRRGSPQPRRQASQPQVAAVVPAPVAAALRLVERRQGRLGVRQLHRQRGPPGQNRGRHTPGRLRHGEGPQRGPHGYVQRPREVPPHRLRLRRCCRC